MSLYTPMADEDSVSPMEVLTANSDILKSGKYILPMTAITLTVADDDTVTCISCTYIEEYTGSNFSTVMLPVNNSGGMYTLSIKTGNVVDIYRESGTYDWKVMHRGSDVEVAIPTTAGGSQDVDNSGTWRLVWDAQVRNFKSLNPVDQTVTDNNALGFNGVAGAEGRRVVLEGSLDWDGNAFTTDLGFHYLESTFGLKIIALCDGANPPLTGLLFEESGVEFALATQARFGPTEVVDDSGGSIVKNGLEYTSTCRLSLPGDYVPASYLVGNNVISRHAVHLTPRNASSFISRNFVITIESSCYNGKYNFKIFRGRAR